MSKSIISTDHTMKEIATHGTYEFPLFTSNRFTFFYDMGFVSWHWHNEFELTFIESGSFEYAVGSDTFSIEKGEAILINSKTLHQVKPLPGETPVYYSYIFTPEFLCPSPENLIYKKYILPLIKNSNFPYYVFQKKVNWEEKCLHFIQTLNQLSECTSFTKELQIQHLIQSIFIEMIENLPTICTTILDSNDSEKYSLMKIMRYINENYSQPITLNDMAKISNISKSTLNRLFQKTLKMTPIEYLLDFRINQSLPLLARENQSVTTISSACGFQDVSYFCKIFKQRKGISPLKFRNNCSSFKDFS